ncbi:MAG: hypothetical protein ACE5FO_06375 [Parvularculaceae bacterium]
MCANRKQKINPAAAILLAALMMTATASAGERERAALAGGQAGQAGGVALGDSQGGVTDRAYVIAPPNWTYVVEKEPGSFLDCGTGMDNRTTDSDGRDLAGLRCGVTLTETVVIPAAAASARIVIHY